MASISSNEDQTIAAAAKASKDQHQHQQSQDLELLQDWRSHPAINPTLVFPTLLVPSISLQKWIQKPKLQPFLAKPSNWELLQHVHPRIKMVQEYNDTHKLVLLLSPEQRQQQHQQQQPQPQIISTTANCNDEESISQPPCFPEELSSLQDDGDNDNDSNDGTNNVERGPDLTKQISYPQLSFGYILSQLLPPHIPPPSAYEQIGHIAHFNLKPIHSDLYGALIGQVLRETNPAIDTVVNKVGQVQGKYRTYDLQVLAGPNELETTVVEHGMHMQLNVAECYWCTRLSGERQEVLKDISLAAQAASKDIVKEGRQKQQQQQQHENDDDIDDNLVIADVFCGVGALCLLAARQHPNATILANDWNPKAIDYFQRSIDDRKNGFSTFLNNNKNSNSNATAVAGASSNKKKSKQQFQLQCGDAYDFLMDLGASKTNPIPDHVLMNFPLEAPSFLGALRWWPSKRFKQHYKKNKRVPRFHVYTFAKKNDLNSNLNSNSKTSDDNNHNQERENEEEEEVAVDIIAKELLPYSMSDIDGDDAESESSLSSAYVQHRRDELNQEFDANVSTRVVREVAPGKVVVCVSFSLTPKLVRYMQGDYS